MTDHAPEPAEAPTPLQRKIRSLPPEPGVYLFLDAVGRIVYVGKATNLLQRVRTYFHPGSDDGRPLFRFLVRRTADVECIVCANELEALLLENNLIKKHRPRYNIRLRDDKSYLSIRVTTAEKWPRVQPVRGWKDDGNLYFGPYSSAQSVREMLRVIKKYIPLRTCSNGFFDSRTRPCLEYEIGHCTAPCVSLETEEGYRRIVEETVLFLRGKNQTLLPLLEAKMQAASAARDFERAAKVRDQIAAIQRVFEKQKVQEIRLGDLDSFGLYRREDFVSIQVLLSRDGKLLHSSTHSFRTPLSDDSVISSFLTQFYQGERYLPPEVLVPFEFTDRPLLEQWLSERARRKVRVAVPARGAKKRLVEMAQRNAEVNSASDALRTESAESLALSLAEKLTLAVPPHRIECYDISGTRGAQQVASRVVFENGEADTSQYRRYKIRSVTDTDDFASMLEVLRRRFGARKLRDPLPDLVIVDGGKGQIASAVNALAECQVQVPVIGLAKERNRRERSVPERVFVPGRSEPLDLDQSSPTSLFLQRIRDEAHRFANTFQRELKRKQNLATGLEQVPGVGAKRRKALLAYFGNLKNLQQATETEIAQVRGIGAGAARATYRFLHPDPDRDPTPRPGPGGNATP
ncbi:MAG: excinuclease ABC subunit UvrC [Planctomycetota bacterium]